MKFGEYWLVLCFIGIHWSLFIFIFFFRVFIYEGLGEFYREWKKN